MKYSIKISTIYPQFNASELNNYCSLQGDEIKLLNLSSKTVTLNVCGVVSVEEIVSSDHVNRVSH